MTTTVKNKLDAILAETGGELLYTEQVLKILTDVVGLSIDEANAVRKDYGKRHAFRLEQCRKLIAEKLGDNEITQYVIELLEERSGHTMSHLWIKTMEDIKMRTIDSILDMANGSLVYGFQGQMILEQAANLTSEVADEILVDYMNGKDLSLHKITIEVHSQYPKVAQRILELLAAHAKQFQFENMALIGFEKDKNPSYKPNSIYERPCGKKTWVWIATTDGDDNAEFLAYIADEHDGENEYAWTDEQAVLHPCH